jgi:hypothetical protein
VASHSARIANLYSAGNLRRTGRAAGSISGTPPFWARTSSSAVGSDFNQVIRSRPTREDPQ